MALNIRLAFSSAVRAEESSAAPAVVHAASASAVCLVDVAITPAAAARATKAAHVLASLITLLILDFIWSSNSNFENHVQLDEVAIRVLITRA
jgi:hypothetical protein